jgi:predicted  nucleic acid-binding Zn-ribbon protein
MPETDTTTTEQSDRESGPSAATQLDRTLDQWRSRIDELTLQIDLATHDLRDELRKRLEVTENVYLAIRSRLSDARRDASGNAAGLRQGVDQLLRDLRQGYEDAEAVVTRSHQAKL